MKPRLAEQLRFLREVHHFCKPPRSFRPPFGFSLFMSLCPHAYFEINLHLCTFVMSPEEWQEEGLRTFLRRRNRWEG